MSDTETTEKDADDARREKERPDADDPRRTGVPREGERVGPPDPIPEHYDPVTNPDTPKPDDYDKTHGGDDDDADK